MPVPPIHARRALTAAPLAMTLIAIGCGSGDDGSTSEITAAPQASSFPGAEGKTLDQLAAGATKSDVVVAPTVSVFEEGENRYAFGLFTVDRQPIMEGQVALYAARPDGKALGPFPAMSASMATKPAFASVTTTGDPDAATNIYRTEVDLPGDGEWRMLALIREDDGSYSYTVPLGGSAIVGADKDAVPDVGEKAPMTHTPTTEDVGGDLTEIDTRQPPDTMHELDYADVLGQEPIVLSFATPALCTSRVCGPVVDIAEEVKTERPDDAAYIHMEIYEDNDVNKGVNEQVQTFGLPSEPWLFVIDSDGKVASRIEGAFSADELTAAIDGVS